MSKKIFVLLTNPFQLIFAETICEKLKSKNKIGIIINPTLSDHFISLIKYNANILGYRKILDLRKLGKEIHHFEKIKLSEKLFNSKKFQIYLKKKVSLKKKLKNKIGIKNGDIFILRKKYNIHEQIFYFNEIDKYLFIRDGLDFLYKRVGNFGILFTLRRRLYKFISNLFLSLKFMQNKNFFLENVKLDNIKFNNNYTSEIIDKKIPKALNKVKKFSNEFKNTKVFIFGHPLIENKRLFNTNGKKEAKIYNFIGSLAIKKFNLENKDIIIKLHPRLSHKNFKEIKKYLKFKTVSYFDNSLSESFLYSKKIKAIYTFGSSIGFYSKYYFGFKNYYVSIRNLDINEKYANILDKRISKFNFETIKLSENI